MNDFDTQRPFKQRFLDGFERSRIRAEVQRSKRSRIDSLKRRYATMVLGASLAVGSIGVPMKMATNSAPKAPASASQNRSVGDSNTRMFDSLAGDLQAANQIAREVTGGVDAAAKTIAAPIAKSVDAVAKVADLSHVREAAREEFFKKEIPFGSLIYKEAKKNDLDPALVAAVVQQESRFIPTARSHAGAQGLMQLVPRTGRWMGAKNLMNPAENVRAGAKYLKYLNERFDGNEKKVIAAYNAGEGNVQRFGGIPPFKETRNYVKKVMNYRQEFDERMNGKLAETLETQIASVDGVGAAQ
jgi:soluble lytic murein transglycosylase-like protein